MAEQEAPALGPQATDNGHTGVFKLPLPNSYKLLAGAEEEENIVADEEEPEGIRVAPDPGAPSQSEIDKHAVLHIPFRNWCPWCVRGKCREAKCLPTKTQPGAIPCISSDYMFMGDKQVPGTTPIITRKDNVSKTPFADIVPEKGAHDFTVNEIAYDMDTLGYTDVIF